MRPPPPCRRAPPTVTEPSPAVPGPAAAGHSPAIVDLAGTRARRARAASLVAMRIVDALEREDLVVVPAAAVADDGSPGFA